MLFGHVFFNLSRSATIKVCVLCEMYNFQDLILFEKDDMYKQLIILVFQIAFFSFLPACKQAANANKKESLAIALLALTRSQQSEKVTSTGFVVTSGNQVLDCNTASTGTVANASGVVLQNLSLFVHDVKLIKSDGSRVSVSLEANSNQDGSNGVVLFRFTKAGTGSCNGATSTYTSLRMKNIAEETYNGIEFTVGIPWSKNHLNANIESAPYNDTTTFWSWAGGYKFITAEVKSNNGAGNVGLFHLGSTNNGTAGTACDSVTASTGTAPPASQCTFQNRSTVTLTKANFNPSADRIAIDIQALFNGIDISAAAKNCMSGRSGMMGGADNCQQFFTNIGVNWLDGSSAGAQTAFKIL